MYRVGPSLYFRRVVQIHGCEWKRGRVDRRTHYSSATACQFGRRLERHSDYSQVRSSSSGCYPQPLWIEYPKQPHRNLEQVKNKDTVRNLSRKMAPPLVTLLSTEPEIQYVALRNINLIVQKRPAILANEIKVFFCKYNDPIYVKVRHMLDNDHKM